jgi:hypothetical protein
VCVCEWATCSRIMWAEGCMRSYARAGGGCCGWRAYLSVGHERAKCKTPLLLFSLPRIASHRIASSEPSCVFHTTGSVKELGMKRTRRGFGVEYIQHCTLIFDSSQRDTLSTTHTHTHTHTINSTHIQIRVIADKGCGSLGVRHSKIFRPEIHTLLYRQ